jgi:phosphatidylserine/phosphatidylglycerophosphate/cardiolipin synthase-like enzyme
MKRFFLCLSFLLFSLTASAETFNVRGQCSAFFSPNGGGTAAIVDLLSKANTDIYVLAYSFTSQDIVDALAAAKQRGVVVKVIVDSSQLTAKGSKVVAAYSSGIQVWIDATHNIAHNKVIIVDGKYLETGSFNFSVSAERSNAENVLICFTTQGAAIYKKNWDMHLSHSTLYTN